MSTRALRKHREKTQDVQQETKSESDEAEENETGTFDNRFSMLEENGDSVGRSPKSLDELPQAEPKQCPKKPKSKKSKKKNQKSSSVQPKDESIEAILKSIGVTDVRGDLTAVDKSSDDFHLNETALFQIEHRNLNPENELKRIFGKKVLDVVDRRPMQKVQRKVNRKHAAGGKLVKPKNTENWVLGKTGLSMQLRETLPSGVNVFAFEHGIVYQQAQLLFWEAVELMNPEAFVAILREHPFHVDTLLQMSDVYRINEDFGTARELVERALYACESAFHPLFNIAVNNSRLDYRQQENRPFFLALYKHMQYMCQRACLRTALEFCKLIYSLDPDEDPLGMLLIVDYLCLRSRLYEYLINLFHVLEAKRNLSQLPNFCYSVALATYLKCEEHGEDLAEANEKLQNALVKFPTMLLPLLDKCGVEPDSVVSKCEAFSISEQLKDGSGLRQLIALYTTRCNSLWKETAVIGWLETNVHAVLPRLKDSNQLYKQFRIIRTTRFQSTPLNVWRHLVLSDIKETLTNLPPSIAEKGINSHDPLPPPDSRCAYSKPERAPRLPTGSGSFMGSFLRSLLPNYNPDAVVDEAPAEDGAVAAAAGGGGTGAELQRSVQTLLQAMRELLNDIQPTAAPREDNAHDNNENEDDDDWNDFD